MSKWIVFHFGLKLLTQEASVFRVVWNRRHNWKSRTHWLRQIGWEIEIVVGVMPPQLPHWDSLAATSRLFSHPLLIPRDPITLSSSPEEGKWFRLRSSHPHEQSPLSSHIFTYICTPTVRTACHYLSISSRRNLDVHRCYCSHRYANVQQFSSISLHFLLLQRLQQP